MSDKSARPPQRPDGSAQRGPSTVAVVVGLLVVIALSIGLWFTAPATGDRLLTVVVATAIAAGVVGQHGAPRGASRWPAALQGVVVGAAIGVAAAVLILQGVQAWGLLWGVIVLPMLYPAVVPARWRQAVTARWSDLSDRPQ